MDIAHLLEIKVKGFLEENEATRLYELARMASKCGPCLEIGSYCGKSTLFLGAGCKKNGAVLFSIDHHRGSEEQQPGQEYHDPELMDPVENRFDTFRFFRKTIEQAELNDTVIPLVCTSTLAARQWATPLALVFIDGGHSFEAAVSDYVSWAGHIMPGGFLLIHDIFFDSAKGGQAPRTIYEMAIASGLFEEMEMVGTLGALKRKSGVQMVNEADFSYKDSL